MSTCLSGVILTKNNLQSLKRSLDSISFVDELLLIDDNSDKEIHKIAKEFGATIYTKQLGKDFASQRNFGLNMASGKWVLFLDSDEVITSKLKQEILMEIKTPKAQVYKIKRKNIVFGKRVSFGDYKSDEVVRLISKDSGKWTRKVHEKFVSKEKIYVLDNHLLHYPHKNVGQFIEKLNFYSTIHACENSSERKRVNLFIVLIFPFLKFVYLYVFKLGIRDGKIGFILAFLSSFHSFSSWAKYYLSES